MTAREYRNKLLACIWKGAKQLERLSGEPFDPRSFAPQRPGITGQKGDTLSRLTINELIVVAYTIKRAGARVYVPRAPRGILLNAATPWQLDRLHNMLANNKYLVNPDSFFKERLQVQDPKNPTFREATRMLAFLGSKERSLNVSE